MDKIEERQTKLTSECKEDPTSSPHEFSFPFEPYTIQLDLMKTVYSNLEDKKFALVESPTGTGKSLSLICSSLTWLRNYQTSEREKLDRQRDELSARIEKLRKEEEESGDWLTAQTQRKDVTRSLEEVNNDLDRLLKFERKSEARQHARLFNIPLENYIAFQDKVLEGDKKAKLSDIDITEYLCKSNEINCSSDNDQDTDVDLEKRITTQDEDQVRPKIYYASRTHSQLSQFINEIKRTSFSDCKNRPPIKVVPLASRANLCVNQDVLRLKDPNAINEKCTEMSRESNKEKRCPYAKPNGLSLLRESILTSVQDIEDITRQGRYIGACPYYASRLSVAEAEVVVLPYNNLLHHETRKASNLDLKDAVVVIDEAHNILETICSIHSSSITGQQLVSSHTILSRYYKKFHNRMSPKNAEMVKKIVSCITALISFLNDPIKHLNDYEDPKSIDIADVDAGDAGMKIVSNLPSTRSEEVMIDVLKFIGASNVEKFNIFKIIDYFNRSQLARKLIGFFKQDATIDLSIELSENANQSCNMESDSHQPAKRRRKMTNLKQSNIQQETNGCNTRNELRESATNLSFLTKSNPNLLSNKECFTTSYPIYTLIEFFRALTNLQQDGKVLVNVIKNDVQRSSLKFVLLNPSSQFKQMTQDSRSIVLAGGTMQPFGEFVDLLFKPLGVNNERMILFSCSHVIKPDQLHVSTLSCGPTGKPLELSFKTRSNFETIDEIGRSILGISSLVPGGMVCFLPSYDYEQFCYNRWTQMGLIRAIETKCKRVFREPRQSTHMKAVWDEYCRTIERNRASNKGALLLCIVGGKMSEGINFNDDLGRCIVMVGLPYANIKSIELQQKMAYYDRTCKKEGISAGQEYYENLCIKGLNQSIGRAIRHRDDYAAIILLDRRYTIKQTIRNGLPQWIGKSLKDEEQFGNLLSQMRTFYSSMRRPR